LALQESPELSAYGEYRDALGALKFTSQEVTEAHNYFSGSLFLNNEASEGTFKALEGSAQILHLAMHALVDEENPLRSKLIFSQSADTTDDGFLHAYELYNLRLNAELAVLSACNTGFGPLSEGEGVTSLSRAFSYAGCKSIVMSLWPAQDKSTLDIMSLFYKGLSEGLSKDQALRQAKLQYLANADDLFASPFFWANFVVSGSTQPLTQKLSWVYYLLGGLGLAFAGFMGYRLGKPKKT
jgi:CHAT domain-containing protein